MINIISNDTKTYYFPIGKQSDAEELTLKLYSELSHRTQTFTVSVSGQGNNFFKIVITNTLISTVQKGEYEYTLLDGEESVSFGLIRFNTGADAQEYEPTEDYVVYEELEDGYLYVSVDDQTKVDELKDTIRSLNDLIEDQQDTIRNQQEALDYKDEVISEMEDVIYSVEPITITHNGEYVTSFEENHIVGWNKVTVNVPRPSGIILVDKVGEVNVTNYSYANVQLRVSGTQNYADKHIVPKFSNVLDYVQETGEEVMSVAIELIPENKSWYFGRSGFAFYVNVPANGTITFVTTCVAFGDNEGYGIDWGDGTVNLYNGDSETISHTYTDGYTGWIGTVGYTNLYAPEWNGLIQFDNIGTLPNYVQLILTDGYTMPEGLRTIETINRWGWK